MAVVPGRIRHRSRSTRCASRASLSPSDLSGSDLSGSDLSGSDFIWVRLTRMRRIRIRHRIGMPRHVRRCPGCAPSPVPANSFATRLPPHHVRDPRKECHDQHDPDDARQHPHAGRNGGGARPEGGAAP
ncbi:pentapeptide repeat-containing protein [Streptomyces lavendulae]|uniref:pentapeptide repeat-containing protein n=1 Tax=Streptomyces lavendulae TaxID=1914 RepID=UPI00340A2515